LSEAEDEPAPATSEEPEPFVRMSPRGYPWDFWEDHPIGKGILITFALVGGVAGVAFIAAATFVFLATLLEVVLPVWGRVLLCAGVLGGGWGLFLLRKHVLWLYGLVEVGVAIGIANHTAAEAWPKGGVGWVAIVGAVYVVVRGLDNITTGWKKSFPNGIKYKPPGPSNELEVVGLRVRYVKGPHEVAMERWHARAATAATWKAEALAKARAKAKPAQTKAKAKA
jgi:hypothetical protein